MPSLARIIRFFRMAPWWLRVRVVASTALAAFAVLMFVLGHLLVGIVAAALYVIDLAVVGPVISLALARRRARRR